MYRYFNNFSAALAADIDDNDVSVSVITDLDLSSIDADNPMVGTLVQGDVIEIVNVIGVAEGDPGILILDIERGVEGTTPAAFSTAARLECRWTAESARRSQRGVPAGALVQFATSTPPAGYEHVGTIALFSAGGGMRGFVAETKSNKFAPAPITLDGVTFDAVTDAVAATNNVVYIFGIADSNTPGYRPFLRFDPLTGTYSWLASPHDAYPGLTFASAGDVSVCATVNGFVFAHAGGMSNPAKLLKYDIEGNTWSETSAPSGITDLTNLSLTSIENYVYLIGFNPTSSLPVFLRYNALSDTWTDLSASLSGLLTTESRGGLISDYDGINLYFLRRNGGNVTLHRYSTSGNTWSEMAGPGETNDGNNQHPRLACLPGKLYSLHGNASTTDLSVYDIGTDTWSEVPVNAENEEALLGGDDRLPRTILVTCMAQISDPISGAKYFRAI